jgi:Zn-dependent M28 family amino/carboxypeptidase
MAQELGHALYPYASFELGIIFILCACSSTAITNEPSPTLSQAIDQGTTLFDGQRAFEHVQRQMEFGARIAGSQGNIETRTYIETSLKAEGWTVNTQYFDHEGVQLANVVARNSAQPPGCIVGAHFDTRSLADQDPESPNSPVPGANDGASGVGVLLELARVVKPASLNKSIWMVFFDAEDNGNLGSWEWSAGASYFASKMQVTPSCVIVIDMVGDIDQQFYYELNSDNKLQSYLWQIADTLGYSSYFIQEKKYSIIDDHLPFVQKGIPSVDIIDFDYPYWHTTHDTLDKVSSVSLERIGRVLEYFFEHDGIYP